MIAETRRRFRLSDSEERQGLEDLYAALVRRAVGDRRLSEEEKSDLGHLRDVFRISPSSARTLYHEIAGGVYAAELRQAATDESVTPAERAQLEGLAADLQLPETSVESIRKDEIGRVLGRVLDRSIADRRLSPEEEQHLKIIAADLGAEVRHDAATSRTLDRYRLLWRIENGEMPTMDVPVHLHRGEVCHATLNSSLYEPRIVTSSVGYHGPRMRIRIAKGLYWNAGRVFLSPDRREEWRALDSGTLYITNKRLVFDGSTKSTSLLWRRVLDFEVYQDGLKIEKDSGRDQLFKTDSADMEVVGAVVAAARGRSAN